MTGFATDPYHWPRVTGFRDMSDVGSGFLLVVGLVALYSLLGTMARRRRHARVRAEVEYQRPTIDAVCAAHGATANEVEYSLDQPFVSVTLTFPDQVCTATCRDRSYEEAIIRALGRIVDGRREALELAERLSAAAAEREAAKSARAAGGARGGWRPGGAKARASRVSAVIDDDTPWHEVLGVPAQSGRREIDRAYRTLAKRFHPDRGGAVAVMVQVNRARADGLRGL